MVVYGLAAHQRLKTCDVGDARGCANLGARRRTATPSSDRNRLIGLVLQEFDLAVERRG
jgi:hypothetical protein